MTRVPSTTCDCTTANGRRLARAHLSEVIVTVAEHRIDCQDAFEIVADRHLVRRPDATVDLDRTFCNRPSQPADLRLQQRDVARLRMARLDGRGAVQQRRTCLQEGDLHVSEAVRKGLEGGDRHAELLPRSGVGGGGFQQRAHGAHGLCGERDQRSFDDRGDRRRGVGR
jgi:hypothetical protein